MSYRRDVKRSNAYWIPAVLFVLLTISTAMVLTYTLKNNFHTVGFITATIMASIGFHLFSLGNTAYACAASLEKQKLTDYGYQINQNGIYATCGTGGVFLCSVLWFLFSNIGAKSDHIWYVILSNTLSLSVETVDLIHFYILRAGIVLGILIFAVGFLNQGRYSDWYVLIVDEVGKERSHTTIIDEFIASLQDLFGSDSAVEKEIDINQGDPDSFHVLSMNAPDEVQPGEEYSIAVRIENNGDQQGARRIICKRDDVIVGTTKETLPSKSESLVEFTDEAPESGESCTLRIRLKDPDQPQ